MGRPAVADDVLRWQTVPETTVTLRRSVTRTAATWTGQVTIPADGAELQILLVEEERLFAVCVPGGPEAVTSPRRSRRRCAGLTPPGGRPRPPAPSPRSAVPLSTTFCFWASHTGPSNSMRIEE
jgi:hypothetical protein